MTCQAGNCICSDRPKPSTASLSTEATWDSRPSAQMGPSSDGHLIHPSCGTQETWEENTQITCRERTSGLATLRNPRGDDCHLRRAHWTPRTKVGVSHTTLCPGLQDKPVAASQRRLGPFAKLPCFLHLWTYGVTKLSLGERGIARLRPGPFHSHR